MDYQEIVDAINENVDKGARLTEAMTPVLVDMLCLEEPWELQFSEMQIIKHRTHHDKHSNTYSFGVNFKVVNSE